MNESEVDFHATDAERYRAEWHAVQAGFVDDPEAAVRAADKLVTQVMDTVVGQLAERRKELTSGATNGDGRRTEQLRVALRRYRMLFGQLTGLTATENDRARTTTGPARTPATTGDENGVLPPNDDARQAGPSNKSSGAGAKRADASKPVVDGDDELDQP